MGSQLRVCVAIFSVLLLAELSFCRMYSTYRSLTKKLRPRKTSVNTRKFPVHHRGKLQNQGKYGKYRMSDDEAEPHEVLWQKAQRRKMKRHHYKAPREDPSDGLDDISILEVKQSRIEDQTFQCLNKALKSTATEPMPPPDLGAGSPANNPGIDSTLLSEDTGDLQLTSDIQTMLYQYLNLPSNIAGEINSCMINMAPSQRRCEVIYGTDQCEPVRRGHTKHFTYWAKRCPNKYLRYGCCKCVLACESDSLVGEPEGVSNLFCVKKGQYEIPTSEGFVTLEDCQGKFGRCEYYGKGGFFPKCKEGYKKLNQNLCFPQCPHGWPDLGDKCLKTGTIGLGAPFTWVSGDGPGQ